MQTDGRKDGETILYIVGSLLLLVGSLTNTTAGDWHLKVKDMEYHVSLTKNHCITVTMQTISSIYLLILKVQ